MTTDTRLDKWFEAAERHLDDGREAAAVEILSRYVEHRLDHARAWLLLGDGLRILGRKKEAQRALLRAEAIASDDSRFLVQCQLGALYAAWGKYDEAEESFAKATADPHAAQAGYLWIMRGAALASAGRLAEAEACHRKASTLDDVDRDEALLNLGYVLRAQCRYAEAAAAFGQAVALDSECQQNRDGVASLQGISEVLDRVKELEAVG